MNGYSPIFVFLSDGSATDLHESFFANSFLTSFGWRFITVGIGPDVNEYVLSKLASNPVEKNFIASSGEGLWTFAKKLAGLICLGKLLYTMVKQVNG
jgi:hypothetical protein